MNHLVRDNFENEFVRVISREGNFNILNPSEVSISTHIAICTETSKVLRTKLSCNITTEEIIDQRDPEFLAFEIIRYLRHVWTSQEDRIKEVHSYLLKNKDRLRYGNAIREYNVQTRKLKQIRDSVNILECEILDYEDDHSRFVCGAWVSDV